MAEMKHASTLAARFPMLDTSTSDAYLRGDVLSLLVPAEPDRKVDVHVFYV